MRDNSMKYLRAVTFFIVIMLAGYGLGQILDFGFIAVVLAFLLGVWSAICFFPDEFGTREVKGE